VPRIPVLGSVVSAGFQHSQFARSFRLVCYDAATDTFSYRSLRGPEHSEGADTVRLLMLLPNGEEVSDGHEITAYCASIADGGSLPHPSWLTLLRLIFFIFSLLQNVMKWDNLHLLSLQNIESVLRECRVPVGREGGVVVGSLGAPVGDEINHSVAGADEVTTASMRCILDELGARRILTFGACHKSRWQHIHDLQLRGVTDISIVEQDAEMSLRYARSHEAAVAVPDEVPQELPSSSEVRIWFHAAASVGTSPIRTALEHVYPELVREHVAIASISQVEYEQAEEYAPFAVDGNSRYQLANRLITHNCYELLHGVRPWKDWHRMQQDLQAHQQQQQLQQQQQQQMMANGGAGAASPDGVVQAVSPNPAGSPASPANGAMAAAAAAPAASAPTLTVDDKTSEGSKPPSNGSTGAVRQMRSIHISSKLDAVTADFLTRILCVDKKKRLGCGSGSGLTGWEEVKVSGLLGARTCGRVVCWQLASCTFGFHSCCLF